MKKVLIICAIASVAYLYSCKKDRPQDDAPGEKVPQTAQKSNVQKQGQGKMNRRLTDKQISEITERQTKDFLAAYKQGNEQGKFGGCPFITSINPIILGDDYACSSPSGVTVEFLVNVFEEGSYNYTRSFYEDIFGFSMNGTIINETRTLLCPDVILGEQAGECPRLISYRVTCLTPFWGDMDEISFNTLTTCGSAHGNPPPPPLLNTQLLSLWGCGSPAACEAFYTTNPPTVVITPLGAPSSPHAGTYIVHTTCNQGVICYGPYVFCPNSITLEYRMVSPNVTAWVAGSGFGSGLAAGDYEYRNVVFHYVAGSQSPFTGNSLPSVGTGTFTVL